MESRFDGSTLECFVYQSVLFLTGFFTLGLATPWMLCAFYKWEAEHTIIDGRRLEFIGTGSDLFVRFMLWCLLTFLTLGIYAFWFRINLYRWKCLNTTFRDTDWVID